MGRQSGWRHKPGIYKACPNVAVTSFLCLYKRSVWNCLSYLVLSVLTLNTKKTDMANKQQQTFRMCVCLCPRYLMGGDTHILCVACLGEEHAQSRALTVSPVRCFPCGHSDPAWRSFTVLGFKGADCEYCEVLPLWTLRSRLVFCTVLGFANGSISGARDGHSLISTFTWQVQCLLSGLGSTHCGFFRPDWGTDTSTDSDIWFWGFRCC